MAFLGPPFGGCVNARCALMPPLGSEEPSGHEQLPSVFANKENVFYLLYCLQVQSLAGRAWSSPADVLSLRRVTSSSRDGCDQRR